MLSQETHQVVPGLLAREEAGQMISNAILHVVLAQVGAEVADNLDKAPVSVVTPCEKVKNMSRNSQHVYSHLVDHGRALTHAWLCARMRTVAQALMFALL